MSYAEVVLRKKLLADKENRDENSQCVVPGASKNKKCQNNSDVPDDVKIPYELIANL